MRVFSASRVSTGSSFALVFRTIVKTWSRTRPTARSPSSPRRGSAAQYTASLPIAFRTAAFDPQACATAVIRGCGSFAISTVIVSDRVMLRSFWVNVQTAGCVSVAALNAPTESTPIRLEAVASVSHGQLFAARAVCGKAATQANNANLENIRRVSTACASLFAILRAPTFRRQIGVHMPGNTLRRDLRMYTQEVEGVSRCARIDLLVDEFCLLVRGPLR